MGTCVHTNHISASNWIATASVFPELIFLSLVVNAVCGLCDRLQRALALVNTLSSVSFRRCGRMLDFLV